jgi:hypothetical protein
MVNRKACVLLIVAGLLCGITFIMSLYSVSRADCEKDVDGRVRVTRLVFSRVSHRLVSHRSLPNVFFYSMCRQQVRREQLACGLASGARQPRVARRWTGDCRPVDAVCGILSLLRHGVRLLTAEAIGDVLRHSSGDLRCLSLPSVDGERGLVRNSSERVQRARIRSGARHSGDQPRAEHDLGRSHASADRRAVRVTDGFAARRRRRRQCSPNKDSVERTRSPLARLAVGRDGDERVYLLFSLFIDRASERKAASHIERHGTIDSRERREDEKTIYFDTCD